MGNGRMENEHRIEALTHGIWYRGRAGELAAWYGAHPELGSDRFWSGSGARDIRRMHSGLPALMVDVLTDIVCGELLGVRVSDAGAQADWDRIAEESGFGRLLRYAVRAALAEGDGAFKVAFDTMESDLPLLTFHPANEIRFEKRRYRTDEIMFDTRFEENGRRYLLTEVYGRGGVTYRLENSRGEGIGLETLAATERLAAVVNPRGFMPGAVLMFDESYRYAGRGRSMFDGKTGAFDALDECVSQWVDALRDGRVQTYIPDGYLPRDPETGALRRPNRFGARFVLKEEAAAESVTPRIEIVQPEIRTDALLETYKTFLDLSLTGVLSPSTLGIDVKKLDNAEAQREKEKVTLYTRGRLIGVLREVVPKVVKASIATLDWMRGADERKFDVNVEFGEYANPSFEAVVETVGKAVAAGIMSLENAMEELYGDSKTMEQKNEEVARIRAGRGFGDGAE